MKMNKRKVLAMVVIIYLLALWFQGNEKDEVDNITEMDMLLLQSENFAKKESVESQSFEYIIQGDYSLLKGVEEGDFLELEALLRNGYCEWNLCDMNGDGREELILQEEQENMENDIRRIIGVFVETDSSVECVLWDTDNGYYGDEFYSYIDGKLIHYRDMYEIYRYASYMLCHFDESWEIEKESQYEIIQIDNLETYNECYKNGEWNGIKKIEVMEEGEYYRYTSYEKEEPHNAGITLRKYKWMDKFQEELTEYGKVEIVLARGFYAGITHKLATEVESFEEIINGDMSSLYQIEKEDRNFIKQLAQNGYNEWSLCDINGDGKQELILQERQGELEGNIRHIIAIFAETEEGVKRVLWDIFETGEFYSFIDGRLIHYCYVNGTYNADFYYRCIFDDDWEMREDRLFEILDVTSLDEYDFLSDEMKKEIPSVGFYYRYVTYGENDRETAALLSEDEWRDMFKEEMGEYGRVSTFMHRFAPFDIYVGEVTKEDTDNQSDENNQVTQEPETESPESKIAAMCDTVRAMDFTANEPHMDITPEENQKYLEAYLKVLKNEISIYRQSGEEIYYRDLWKAGDKFEDLLEDKWHDRFYYDDLDGDGKPELAIKQGCLYIFNYELEDETCSIIYDQETCYFGKIIGAGQIWYHDGLHADIIRDRLITFDEENEEVALNLEEGINKKHPYYMVGIGEKEWVDVGKENWDEITAPFFEMIENHGLQEMTLEEVFGEIL